MKRIALVLTAALLMSSAVPVLAQTAQQEETCAIAATTCVNRVKTIEKKIMKMKAEIKAGKQYSMEEMKKLEYTLQEAIDMMNKMEKEK